MKTLDIWNLNNGKSAQLFHTKELALQSIFAGLTGKTFKIEIAETAQDPGSTYIAIRVGTADETRLVLQKDKVFCG